MRRLKIDLLIFIVTIFGAILYAGEPVIDLQIAQSSCIKLFQTDLAQPYYDNTADRYGNHFKDHTADDKYVNGFLADLSKNSFVLDAGGGTGRFLQHILTHGHRPFLIDLSQAMLAVAQKEYPHIPQRQMDITALDFPAGNFNAVFAAYSLIHLSELMVEKALREFYRVLIPHGRVFLALQEGDGQIRVPSPLNEKDIPLNLYTLDQIQQLAVLAGFDVSISHSRNPEPGELNFRKLYVVLKKRD